MIDFDIIVAADERGGIGSEGQLPWQLSGERAHFRALTTAVPSSRADGPPLGRATTGGAGAAAGGNGAAPAERSVRNAVVMGRKTWDSIAQRDRPLLDRLNVVATRNRALALPDGVLRVHGLREALNHLSALRASGAVAQVFVIGGGEIYAQALVMPECRRVHLTRVQGRFDCDTHLPPLGERFALASVSDPQHEGPLQYRYELYERVGGPLAAG